MHEIWLKMSAFHKIGSKLHHRDVVGVALRRLKRDLETDDPAVMEEFSKELRKD